MIDQKPTPDQMPTDGHSFYSLKQQESLLADYQQLYRRGLLHKYAKLQVDYEAQPSTGLLQVKYTFWTGESWINSLREIKELLKDPSLIKTFDCRQLHEKLDEAEATAEELRDQLRKSCELST